ncbi:coiled-coil domain-containing protein 121 [Mirounga leonina]|uniref:coiled-coil domain-containing protein 121 n=1 Tax=Mirounga leonina TaxID=9715 RepID=UPI00156C5912|nr:coiled-coil domain-containing protein 121 [Mirounga leonina]
MGSPRQDPHGSKMRRVRFSFGPQGAGEPAAGAYSAADEVQQLRAGPAGTGAECDPEGCWAASRPGEHGTEKLRKLSARGRHLQVSQAPDNSAPSLAVTVSEPRRDLGDERLDSWSKFAKDSRSSPPPYLSLINNFFKPEKLRNSETRFKEKTVVEMMKLNNQIKQTQIQQELLMEETRQLYAEKLLVQTENKFFLEYLTKKTEEYGGQPEKLCNNYLQKTEEIERRRQESASKYAKQTSVFKRELLQKEKIQFNLKQQLQALRNVSLLKEKQEREIQILQEEKKKTQAETDAKKQEVQVQLLQEKAFLEKQLSEPDMRQLGKRKRKELDRKAQALEQEAKQYTFEFYCSIRRENRELGKKLLQQTQQCQELQAIKSQLKNQKQQLQQEQWYVQCLIRGRQRLQRRHNWCPRQDAPKATITPPLSTKPRINPKQFLK